MGGLLIVLAVIALVMGIAGPLFLSAYSKRTAKAKQALEPNKQASVTFSWKYIILPLVMLLLSLIIVVALGSNLPEQVAYRFSSDGSPDASIGRTAFVVIVLVAQLMLTLMATGLTFGLSMLKVPLGQGALVEPQKIVSFMGNVIGAPQFILFFVMLDIFSYNLYQVHVFPTWLFLLIVLGLATIALIVLLFYLVSRARQLAHVDSGPQDKKDSD